MAQPAQVHGSGPVQSLQQRKYGHSNIFAYDDAPAVNENMQRNHSQIGKKSIPVQSPFQAAGISAIAKKKAYNPLTGDEISDTYSQNGNYSMNAVAPPSQMASQSPNIGNIDEK
jgi:hypothetical protein